VGLRGVVTPSEGQRPWHFTRLFGHPTSALAVRFDAAKAEHSSRFSNSRLKLELFKFK
jgi:hypothetical protein